MRCEKLSGIIGLPTPSGSNLLTPWRSDLHLSSKSSSPPPPQWWQPLHTLGRINHALPEGMVMATRYHARQCRFSIGPTSSSSFCFWTITRLRSYQITKGMVQNVLHEEVCYNTKELFVFSNSFRQKSREHVWNCILRV